MSPDTGADTVPEIGLFESITVTSSFEPTSGLVVPEIDLLVSSRTLSVAAPSDFSILL